MAKKTKAKRIQRKRTKGWKMPKNTVYVGRPSKWGNPFIVSEYDNPKKVVSMYDYYISTMLFSVGTSDEYREKIKEIKGKNLACWCPLDQPCHADVLLKIANS